MKKKSNWNTAPQAKKRGRSSNEITREQLSQAIQSFTENGGLIHKLPPQPVRSRQKVGGHVDSGIESLFDS